MSQLQEPQSLTARQVGTVFIVDDEMMVTSSLQTMLSLETSHTIHCFNHPLDALDQIKALRPDVVISDFSMPGMDGITFLRNVKQALPEATLILLTGYADKESAIEAINQVGIYRYIEKPWDNEELKISINNGLERSRLISDLRRSVQDLTIARAELEQANHRLEALVEERTRDLRSTYEKLQSIVSNTADGILTLNASLEITALNPAAEHWFSTFGNTEKPLSLPLDRLLKLPPETDKNRAGLKALFDPAQSARVIEVSLGDHPLEASIAPLDMQEGFVVVLRDIAERKAIERLREDFISTLTHDLRTPLLAAIQTLGIFADGSVGELNERQQELIRMMIQSSREMLGLVNVLLEVYKYESGRQKLIMDRVDLFDMIGRTCQELDALAQNREQTLKIEHSDGLEPDRLKVHGDKQELKRVLVNLIGNAINFTPKGGTIRVQLSREEDRIQVCVADTGRGIPEKDIPILFQRFSQGTSKQRSSGSGLGLYLSRQIVEAHQGQIWVESEEGKGSRFFVVLPASDGR